MPQHVFSVICLCVNEPFSWGHPQVLQLAAVSRAEESREGPAFEILLD